MERIISFSGLAGSGKSTAAAVAVARGYQEKAFAGALKSVCMSTFALSHEQARGARRRRQR